MFCFAASSLGSSLKNMLKFPVKFPWISVNYKGSCLGMLPYPAYLGCTYLQISQAQQQSHRWYRTKDMIVLYSLKDLIYFYPLFIQILDFFCFDATVKLEAGQRSYPLIIGRTFGGGVGLVQMG